jgi:hypothetical protein
MQEWLLRRLIAGAGDEPLDETLGLEETGSELGDVPPGRADSAGEDYGDSRLLSHAHQRLRVRLRVWAERVDPAVQSELESRLAQLVRE